MKNLNKVLAMLVVFMMVVSTVAFASFTDVAEDSTYNVAVKVGTDLGLFTGYEDGSFKPEGEITRAEFAAIVVRMKGQEAQAEGAKSATMFTDVPATHWAAGYINIAVRLGIINGYGDGNFGPSDLVEYQDAITMIVRALGYEPAIGAAGYPTGYLTKAGDLGLTANVSGVNGVAINRGKVAQIVFNALDVPLMTQSGYGTFTQYVINDGFSATNGQANVKKTILSENHNIVKVQGIVESSSIISNSTNTGIETVDFDVTNALYNKFGIGDRKMAVGDSDAAAYVGEKVIAFVHYNEFENLATIASIYEAPVSDASVVALQDLSVVPASFTGDFKYYNENGRLTTVRAGRLDSNNKVIAPNVYINGVNVNDITNLTDYTGTIGSTTVLKLNAMAGEIEFALLDATNTNADFDTIYITAAKPFVVDEVKTGTSTVKAKNKVGLVSRIGYDAEDATIEAVLYGADGAEMDWADLEENDVLMLTYIETNGKKIYSAMVVENTVEGKVDGTSDKKTVGTLLREVTVAGTTYDVVIGAEAEKTLKSGDEGIFYLDANDNIVYFDVTAAVSKNYGYVIATGEPDAKDFLAGVQIQILTKENEVVVYDFYKTIKRSKNFVDESGMEVVTDTEYAKATDKSKLIPYADIKALEGKVITYNVNSANEITAIFESVDMHSNKIDDGQLDNYFTYDSKAPANLTNFDPDDMSFDNGYTVDENTVIFLKNATKIKDSEVVALPALEEGDHFNKVTLYNVDDNDYISCILIDDAAASEIGGNSDHATFVLKTSETTDEDGNDLWVVTGYKDLEVVTYEVEKDPKLTLGSLVVPEYSVNGKVKSFKEVATTNGEKTTVKLDGTNVDKELYYDNLTKIDGSKLYFGSKVVKIRSNTNIYVYDLNKEGTGRGHYQIDADGYLDYDDPDNDGVLDAGEYGLYYGTDSTESRLTVDAYIFYVDGDNANGDAADIVFVIQ